MFEINIPANKALKYVEILRKVDLFSCLSVKEAQKLLSSMKLVSISGGKILIKKGEEEHSLYVLIQGKLQVSQLDKNGKLGTPFAEIPPGTIVGEISLLTGRPRTATVFAYRDSVLLRISKDKYDEFEKQNPLPGLAIAKTAIERLTTPKKVIVPGQNTRTVCVAPAGDSDHKIFIKKFNEVLKTTKSTYVINQEICNEVFGENIAQIELNTLDDHRLGRWLESLEEEYDLLIFETDRQMTPWTQRCLRQSDYIFFIADPAIHPAMNSIELSYFNEERLIEGFSNLIFLHTDDTTKITGGNEWLKKREVKGFHHIKLNSKEHMEKLCRVINNESIGLVLSGGGARGFAHVGVLRALEELNIPIDYIAGTSMGSIIGGGYSLLGYDLLKEFTKDFANGYKRDYTFPFISLSRGNHITNFFQQVCGDSFIEDLWVKFFCVSTNVTKGTLHIHEKGHLWKAMRTSASIPAVFPPLYDSEGDMYIDGGILNNMPVNIMRKTMHGGKVIAVDCCGTKETKKCKFYDTAQVSGWKLLFKHLSDFDKNAPKYDSIVNVILTSMTIGADAQQQLMGKEADYLLNLDTSNYNLLDFRNAEEIIQKGYEDAIKNLPKLFEL